MTAIEDAERRLRAAMLAGDVAALDGLLMDDLVFVDQGGRVLTKAMDLEAHQSGLLRLSRLELSEVLVRPAADAVLVVVRADLAGSWDDTPFGGASATAGCGAATAACGAWPQRIAARSPAEGLPSSAPRDSIGGRCPASSRAREPTPG